MQKMLNPGVWIENIIINTVSFEEIYFKKEHITNISFLLLYISFNLSNSTSRL